MQVKVIVPQVGQSIAEATIVKWFHKPGEHVEKGETLVEIGTDKINTEIPAPESGVVEKLLVKEGETVPVTTEIAVLAVEGTSPVTPEQAPRAARIEEGSPVSVDTRAGDLVSSPLVRKLAREYDIDLATVKGRGAGGRITKEDIMKIVEARESGLQETRTEVERVPMSRMRKLIAQHMVLSKRTTAELTTFFEVDMSEVVRRRDLAKERINITYLPFVLFAVAKALKSFPILNASLEGEEVVFHKQVHLGIAVALDEGLVVPVIKGADQLDVAGLAGAAQDLSERARSKRLTAVDLEGGTFTVTNPGVFGALMGTPIIHQPQVAILGFGAVVKRPVVVNDAIEIRPMAYLSLTYDHRALDGATADRFLAHIKNTLEKECPPALP
jgi:2-oxoglutarate dehydrogenase E2 component (dihydrolipoamide succinyltransferase)/2-oxoisovalerate dehydrogenase E2 component (dihydrolipoyl transacylase)